MIVQIGVLPLLWVAMRWLSKKQAYYISVSLYGAISFTLFFLPADYSDINSVLLCAAGLVSAASVVIQAMMPDTIQAYLNTTDGTDDKATLYSITLLGIKLGGAAALSLSSYILGIVGYDAKAPEQTDTVKLTLRILCFMVPVFLLICGSILMFFAKDYSQFVVVVIIIVISVTDIIICYLYL